MKCWILALKAFALYLPLPFYKLHDCTGTSKYKPELYTAVLDICGVTLVRIKLAFSLLGLELGTR
jgi:hypothetical protein